ncbi:MAG: helix-turn-helix transcriptional regulator, partial [Burkholderiales bacterium]|nr:helix-turn-helix transcriptional regulator [Burkholderiales bacterium]
EDCAAPWTLEGLAARAGLSRTVLAERFRSAMGETPLAYLRTVRMQKAVRLLSETSRTLEQVAREVGYQDAFGFSRAFKRSTGLAPRAFRQRDQRDRADPMRLDAGLREGFA